MDVLLGLLVLAAVPINIALSRRIRRVAGVRPRLLLLDLLSFTVTKDALLTVLTAILAVHAIVFTLTGVRLIPTPGATLIIVAILLGLSLTNVVVWWRMRSPVIG